LCTPCRWLHVSRNMLQYLVNGIKCTISCNKCYLCKSIAALCSLRCCCSWHCLSWVKYSELFYDYERLYVTVHDHFLFLVLLVTYPLNNLSACTMRQNTPLPSWPKVCAKNWSNSSPRFVSRWVEQGFLFLQAIWRRKFNIVINILLVAEYQSWIGGDRNASRRISEIETCFETRRHCCRRSVCPWSPSACSGTCCVWRQVLRFSQGGVT